ncbi:hypothetical protein QAD02_019265 [Eretmocerus hayati]|uniref:Uncharacterized protein n=1 Tax=Eretmocerus hayati TaxID=131215 RepID=A0ACC2PKA0_9HYME|nr:hypothetical protein QAD02_019265 [Eretmocerus hayati]
MYNVNVNPNPAPNSGLLSVTAATAVSAGVPGTTGGEVTPRTPEIVNSLIAMTNPFDGYNGNTGNTGSDCPTADSARLRGPHQGPLQAHPGVNGFGARNGPRSRAYSSSSGEPSPPSIQHTCSQLIKEGLKLTLQTKRRANGCTEDLKKKTRREDGSADDEEDDESSNSRSGLGLTPEDEERRRRRRERNKIAATKCRLKKREKTVILVQESETLETQNHELKSQIQELETQRRRLVDMLNLHGPTCLKQPLQTDSTYTNQYGEMVSGGQLPSYQENFVPTDPTLQQQQQVVVNHQSPELTELRHGNVTSSNFGSNVKLESFEPVSHNQQPQQIVSQHHEYYRHFEPSTYSTTTVPTPDSGCAV